MDEGTPAVPLPAPPGDLSEPNIVTLAVGAVVHRVHDRRFAGNEFNPCQGGPTRFAPVRDRHGDCVPSLYAGSTVESAVYETLFHDVPASARRKTVPMTAIRTKSHSALVARRAIKLASLRAPDLKKWRIVREALLGSLPTQYIRTRMWAKAIHDSFKGVEGLIWTSNQCDPDDSLLFFGDRVVPSDLVVASVREGRFDQSLWSDVRDAGLRGGISITF